MNQRLYGTAALTLFLSGVALAQGHRHDAETESFGLSAAFKNAGDGDWRGVYGPQLRRRPDPARRRLPRRRSGGLPGAPVGSGVGSRKFTLRLNGKKDVLFPQPPGMVAASLKYPDWQQKPQMTVGGGMGNSGVILGQPTPTARFPGDRRAEPRLPAPPQAPGTDAPVEKEPMDITELVQKVALPEGLTRFPVSGYLFFPYSGKLKSLKSVELLIATPSEPLVLRLK